jgi:hypothetical protein
MNQSTRHRTTLAVALVAALAVGTTACDDDSDEPADTVVDDLESEPGVPFDNDVDPGVGTETDERNNQGFESDEPGEVGNQTNPND